MRKLSIRQKKFLRDQFIDNNIMYIEDMSFDSIEKLEALNDYETLYQDANRFLHDCRWTKTHFSDKIK
jgi:hypothetical protein